MSYTAAMTWNDWAYLAAQTGQAMMTIAQNGENAYQKWYQLTYGLTDAQIKALFTPALTDTQLTALKYTMSCLHEMYGALHNVAVAQADRASYFIPFI